MTKTLQFLLSLFIVATVSVNAMAQTITWDKPANGDIAVTIFSADPTTESGQYVTKGTQVLVEAVPADGYYTKSLTANGEDIMQSRTIVVNEDVKLVAEFEAIPADNYIVRYPVAYHTQVEVTYNNENLASGSIVPAGAQIGIRVVPFTGVQISSTTVNGQTLSGSSYTVNSNVAIAYTLNIPEAGVYVNFEPNAENGQIAAMKWNNGYTTTIDPQDQQPVYVTQMVWICGIPDEGYEVDEIMVNGVPQQLESIDVVNPFFGTVTTYTGVKYPVLYTNINITATFKAADGSGINETEKAACTYNYETKTLSAGENVVVFDTTGKALMNIAEGQEVSFDNFNSGLYIIKGENTNLKVIR